mgnify:CR=1 FL=1
MHGDTGARRGDCGGAVQRLIDDDLAIANPHGDPRISALIQHLGHIAAQKVVTCRGFWPQLRLFGAEACLLYTSDAADE